MSGSPTNKSHREADLALIQDFVNTFEAELGTSFEGTEHLPDAAALGAWLGEHGIPVARPPDESDLEAARGFREALRSLLLANNGAPADRDAARLVAGVADRVALRVRVGEEGRASLEPVGDGVSALFARLLGAVALAQEEGTWARLKACPASDCHWAFLDESRNRSRTWCAMDVCGNRAKTRSYRARRSKRQS